MTSTAFDDQFAPEPTTRRESVTDAMRGQIAALELELKRQRERAEAAEAELKQKPAAPDSNSIDFDRIKTPATAVPPEWVGGWLHKSGQTYRVIAVANIHAKDYRYPMTIVYQGEDGRIWSRLASDWHGSMSRKPTGHDWQTTENLTAEQRPIAEIHLRTLRDAGLLREGGFRGNFEVLPCRQS